MVKTTLLYTISIACFLFSVNSIAIVDEGTFLITHTLEHVPIAQTYDKCDGTSPGSDEYIKCLSQKNNDLVVKRFEVNKAKGTTNTPSLKPQNIKKKKSEAPTMVKIKVEMETPMVMGTEAAKVEMEDRTTLDLATLLQALFLLVPKSASVLALVWGSLGWSLVWFLSSFVVVAAFVAFKIHDLGKGDTVILKICNLPGMLILPIYTTVINIQGRRMTRERRW